MEIISSSETRANTVEAVIKADAAEFETAVQSVYLRERKNISIHGFRKGKASRKRIEALKGKNYFYENAVRELSEKTVREAAEQLKLQVVDVPDIEVTEILKESGVSFKVTYTLKPKASISDYKGLKLEKKIKAVTDKDVDEEIEQVRSRNARIVDVTERPAQTGDTVIFDYEGSVDGVPFDCGSVEQYALEIGSGRFIPGFEEQLVGKNIDEEFDVNVSFPEDYFDVLAGKPAVFKCRLHEIRGKELPELDDEFAKDVSEFDTLDEYRADVRKRLTDAAEESAESAFDNAMAVRLVEMTEVDVPPIMYERRVADMLREWEYRNRNTGVTLSDFLKYTGQTAEEFRDSFKAPAEIQVKLRLALEEIARLEHIEVTEEEIEQYYRETSERNKMDIEKVKSIVAADDLTNDITVQKAFDFVKENAEISEVYEGND